MVAFINIVDMTEWLPHFATSVSFCVIGDMLNNSHVLFMYENTDWRACVMDN